MLSTTFLLSKTFLLSQFSPPSAAHAFNYNIPFIKNILFIKIFPPSAAHAFNYIPFIKNIPFITIFPPSAAHAFNYNIPFIKNITFITISPPSAAHNIADTHLPLCDPTWLPFIKIFPPSAAHAFYNIPFIKNIPFITIFPPLCSPQHSRHTFAFVRPYLTSFYQNFSPPLQPMLSTTTFLLSKTFLLSQFSPPLCSPQHSRHTFAFVRPYLTFFYQNFTPPLQPMLSTTFLLSKTFLLSQFSPPSAAHAFNYNIPFIKNIPFITIYPPLCRAHAFNYNIPFNKNITFITIFPSLYSPQHSRHTFAFVRPYLTSFYQNFTPPLQPMLSTTTFLLSKNIPFITIFPPSAAHAFNADTHLPLCDPTWLPFIKIFPPLCSPCFQLHSFYQKHSFYHNFPPPLQPMLSTTTFLLSKTLLLSQFPPPSAAHNIADTHLPLCDPTWLPFINISPPLCSPCFQLQHSFYQKHSFYHNFPPPLQPTT